MQKPGCRRLLTSCICLLTSDLAAAAPVGQCRHRCGRGASHGKQECNHARHTASEDSQNRLVVNRRGRMVQRAVQMVTDSTGLTQAYIDSLNALPPEPTD